MPPLKENNSSDLNVRVLIVIILYGFALYFFPLQSSSFHWDDYFSIGSNEAIKKIDMPKIFNAFNTRSLVGLSFALNYRLCALNPAGYRLINLFIHCLNAFLVYLLIKSTLYLYSARKSIFFCRLEWPAFFASMLFLCHPIQIEPVNFITQRFVLMGTFFYVLTLLLYIQYRCKLKKKYMIASMGSAIAAMFCKEFVVTLPLMLALYDFYFLDPLAQPWWKRCSRMLPFFVIALIVPLLLLRAPPEAVIVANIADSKFIQESNTQKVGKHIDITRAHGSISRKQYFLTELNVVCTYVRLLFLPINQNLDYDYPISHQVDNKTALCGVFLLCLLALAAVMYKSYRIISFSILWFFIALSVESSFIPIGHVIAEYRLYLASVGFVLLVMTLVYIRQGGRKPHMIAAAMLIGFSILTYQRNKVWENEFTLWDDTVRKSPHKARPHYNRGLAYYRQGNFIQAISDYNEAIALKLYVADAYLNRGVAYDKLGNFTKAISDYNKAIELKPKYANTYYNRGNTYYKQGNFIQAISDYNEAIVLAPNNEDGYNNRGLAYYKQGNFIQAISDYNKAIELNPKDTNAYHNLAFIYYKLKKYDQSWANVHKVEELGYPVNAKLINKLKTESGVDK